MFLMKKFWISIRCGRILSFIFTWIEFLIRRDIEYFLLFTNLNINWQFCSLSVYLMFVIQYRASFLHSMRMRIMHKNIIVNRIFLFFFSLFFNAEKIKHINSKTKKPKTHDSALERNVTLEWVEEIHGGRRNFHCMCVCCTHQNHIQTKKRKNYINSNAAVAFFFISFHLDDKMKTETLLFRIHDRKIYLKYWNCREQKLYTNKNIYMHRNYKFTWMELVLNANLLRPTKFKFLFLGF